MKKSAILGIVILAVILLVPVACGKTPEPPPPVPSGSEPPGTPGAASDDIIAAPGGFTYRASIHTQGEPDWPPVPQTQVILINQERGINITYRANIETKAGETRNSIFYLKASEWPELDASNASYEAIDLPDGISVTRGDTMYGGIGGQNKESSKIVMKINIAPDVAPGEYPFDFRVVVDGTDFGNIPCTVKVLE